MKDCTDEEPEGPQRGMVMIFRQLFDSATSTLSYLLGDTHSGEALLIDAVYEQHLRDAALIRELGLKLAYTLETHVHADHVTGAWLMKQALGSKIVVAEAARTSGADWELKAGDAVSLGDLRLEVRATPGHTDGCLTFVCEERDRAFTGDALLIRGAGRTDFQGGSPQRLYQSVREQIFSLDDSCLLYPGHDYAGRTVTTVWEEKTYNPRLNQEVREEDFVGYMNHLGLPHPKKMDEAVPANLQCGRPKSGQMQPFVPAWGPVVRTYAGVWQVEPEWVFAHRAQLTLIDVREEGEIAADPLGHVQGAEIVPLSKLRAALSGLSKAHPIVTLCPAGARSAMAAQLIEGSGIKEVANLRGGLLAWRDLGLPLLRNAQPRQ